MYYTCVVCATYCTSVSRAWSICDIYIRIDCLSVLLSIYFGMYLPTWQPVYLSSIQKVENVCVVLDAQVCVAWFWWGWGTQVVSSVELCRSWAKCQFGDAGMLVVEDLGESHTFVTAYLTGRSQTKSQISSKFGAAWHMERFAQQPCHCCSTTFACSTFACSITLSHLLNNLV